MIRAAIALLLVAAAAIAAPVQARKPNVLIIVADDLGWSDIGAFGGEIATPNLDGLALRGLRLTDFHTAPTCSPTRAMLMSGTDSHRAGLGTMAETIAPEQKGKPGYDGYLSRNVVSLAELLTANGYSTMMAGKWHLGTELDQDPHARGFARSFALLQASHNHFGLNLSTDPSRGATLTEAGVRLAKAPDGFYSSDTFASKLIQFLDESGHAKPFFAYLAFSAPHFPLMAPAETIAKYHGKYDGGYEAMRDARLKRQIALSLVKPGIVAHLLDAPAWSTLSHEQQKLAARNMEVHAAMVDRLDENVGRVITELKRLGQYEDTVIIFMSDNGADGMDIATTPARGLNQRFAAADNRLENRGAATSYLSQGPGWGSAASAPSWMFKGYASQGGTRSPAFIHYHGLARKGVTPVFGHVTDIYPTILDLAGIPDPKGRFGGKPVEPIRGTSWLPFLKGHADHIHRPDEGIGTEMMGARSLRQGDWKITDIGDGKWRLFDIASDPGETRDLAAAEPERMAMLIVAWDAYAKEVGVVPVKSSAQP